MSAQEYSAYLTGIVTYVSTPVTKTVVLAQTPQARSGPAARLQQSMPNVSAGGNQIRSR